MIFLLPSNTKENELKGLSDNFREYYFVFVAEITLQDRAVRKINAQVCSFPYLSYHEVYIGH
jgi:hypothetical protein